MASQEPMESSCTAEEQRNDAPQTPAAPQPSHSREDEDTSVETVNQKEGRAVLCQYFVMGKCRFGHKCRLSHSESSVADPEAVAANINDDDENEEKSQKKKKVKVKQKQNYQEKETNKKPRMRTADDVISRILWDPSVDSSQFVVGYVDRFLGVLERPFCEFNWETNPCDCDYTTELALPRHRIQYFTYRGQRVWDRHSRTDLVFGSTGQSLAPPFGGEGEVEAGPTPNEDVSGLEETELEPCTTLKHLEEEQQNEMNIHTPESALQSKQCTQEQVGLQETCATVPANRVLQSESSSTAVDMTEPENECEENHEDFSSSVGALHVDDDPAAVMNQMEEKKGGRPPKKKPTHFVTFRANTPAILSSFEQLQRELTAALPSSASHWSSVSSLHVTLCLLVLPGPAEVAAAADILRRFADLDRNPPVVLTFPLKLKHFNGRVLYLSPQPHLHLQQLNSGLQEVYREQGLLHRNSFNPRYHLTLAKMQDREGDKVFDGVEGLKVGKGLNFGRLPVNTLHLCAMGGCKEGGFYEILCTVTLR